MTTENIPYTHQVHAARCQEEARKGVTILRTCVQARVGQVVYCASIRHPWTVDDGAQFWSLDLIQPEQLRKTVPVRNVRQCSGLDLACFCECIPECQDDRTAPEARPGGLAEGLTC